MSFITPIEIKKYTNNENNILDNFWEVQEFNSINKSLFNIGIKQDTLIETIETMTKSTLCIQSDKELSPQLLKLINELYKRGVNTYLVTDQIYPSYKYTIVGKVLIRYSKNIDGDMIIIDPYKNSYSEMYISDNLEYSQEKLFYRLYGENKKELYDLFCWRFWKTTDYEVYDLDSLDKNIQVGEVPFDLFAKTDTKYVIHNDHISDNLEKTIIHAIENSIYDITVIAKTININSNIFQKIVDIKDRCKVNLIFGYDSSFDKIVEKIDFSGINLYLTKEEMFMDMIICDYSRCIASSGSIYNDKVISHSIDIKDRNGINDVLAYKDKLLNSKNTYFYVKSKQLKYVNSKYILNDLQNGNVIERGLLKEINEGTEISTSLRNLKDGIVEKTLTTKYPYVNTIIHNITLSPSYRNENFVKDKLYREWENEYLNLYKYLNNIEEDISKIQATDLNIFRKMVTNVFFKNKSYNVNPTTILNKINDLKMSLENRKYDINTYDLYKQMINNIYSDYIKYRGSKIYQSSIIRMGS